MRALVLLLFASILLWGVARFVESGDVVEGAEQPESTEARGEFAPGPAGSDGAGTPVEVPQRAEVSQGATLAQGGRFLSQPTPAAPSEVAPDDTETRGDEPGDWLGVSERDVPRDRTRLAAALLHYDPEELREVLRTEAERLSEDEMRLYLAFSEAMAGRGADALQRARSVEDPDQLDPSELAYLKAALGSSQALSAPPGARRDRPVAHAMSLRLADREAHEALADGNARRAVALLSDLLVEELDAPWSADRISLARWTTSLAAAQRDHRFDPKGDWPALEMKVQPGDSLSAIRVRAIAARPGLVVSTDLIEQVNRLEGKFIQPGDVIRIPTDPVRTLVDLTACWVLVFFGDEVGVGFPCGIGAEETPTITGDFTIGTKRKNPAWFQLGREPIPFGDPENPLGTRWLGWFDADGRTSYGFHGTWEPETIGTAASQGCVRFENSDVEELYDLLPRSSPVHVRP